MRWLFVPVVALLSFGAVQPALASDAARLCQELAGHPDEPGANGIGVADVSEIDSTRAVAACNQANAERPKDAAVNYRLARASVAPGPMQNLGNAYYLFDESQALARLAPAVAALGAEGAAWYAEKAAAQTDPATWRPEAEAGDPLAQMMLFQISGYEEMDWLQKALAQNYPYAHFRKAEKLKPDWPAVVAELELAANAGLSWAQVELHAYYRDGFGVETSDRKAEALLLMAAANGNWQAERILERRASGRPLPRDISPEERRDTYVGLLLALGFLAMAASTDGDSGAQDFSGGHIACPYGQFQVGDSCMLEPEFW